MFKASQFKPAMTAGHMTISHYKLIAPKLNPVRNSSTSSRWLKL